MFGGSSTTGNPLKLQNVPGADNQAYQMASQLAGQNPLSALTPQYDQYSNDIINNPYASMVTGASGMASQIGTTAALGASGASGQEFGAANDVLSAGFDPQNELYNRTQQQLTDQLRATNYASGVGSTPYGAGIEGQGLSNFNIDWQNNQLSRMATAATSSEGLASSATDLGKEASGLYQTAQSIPYEVLNSIATDKLGALDVQTQAATNERSMSEQGLQDLYGYLKLGSDYQSSATGQEAQNLNSQQAGLSTIGSGLGALTTFLGLFL